jgi:hypothetical protein
LIIPLLGDTGGGELDLLSTLLPIICCVVAIPLLSRSGGGGQPSQGATRESDIWFTTQNIDEAYETINKEVDSWRTKAEEEAAKPKSFLSRLTGGGKKGPRFVIKESIAPRLNTIGDPVVGTIYFELVPVEEGGTTVKASYSSAAKNQIVDFKARSPLTIPRVPIGNNCPSCGKAVLREFTLCPYCGQKLVSS